MRSWLLASFASAALVLVSAVCAYPATVTWSGGGLPANAGWSSPLNWAGGAPPGNPTADAVAFADQGGGTSAVDCAGAAWQVGGLTVSNAAGTHTISLNGKTLAVTGKVSIAPAAGAAGTIETKVNGRACGLDLSDGAGLSVVAPGKIAIVFAANQDAGEKGEYWGLRWKGDHQKELSAMLSGDAKLIAVDTGAINGTAKVSYDDTYTYISVRQVWPPVAAGAHDHDRTLYWLAGGAAVVAGAVAAGSHGGHADPGPPPITPGLSDVTVNSNDIIVTPYDDTAVDGDRVELILNGVTVVADLTLVGPPGTPVALHLNSGVNTLTVHALDEGTTPPNTAAMGISNVTAGPANQSWDLHTGETDSLTITAP